MGIKFERLEDTLKKIGGEQDIVWSVDYRYAEFLVELDLVYEVPQPTRATPAFPSEPLRNRRSLLETMAATAEMLAPSGRQSRQGSKIFRLTQEGFVAYNAGFVLFDDSSQKSCAKKSPLTQR